MHNDTPTLRLPMPGGSLAALRARNERPAAASSPAAARDAKPARLAAGINPLLRAAEVLLALVAQLRASAVHADPASLRGQLLERIADFEALALANAVPAPQITAARYLLCSFVDETIAATPWGAHGPWAERNLLQHFHEEREGGDKAFKLLERLGEDPAANANLLELFYVCLALGYEGRVQGPTQTRPRAQLDAIAARLHDVLQRPLQHSHKAKPDSALSQHWAGIATRGHRDAAVLPWWALAALVAALLMALWFVLNARLESQAAKVFARIVALAPALPQDGAIARTAQPRLAAALKAEADAGALEVRDEALRSVITLPSDALFEPGTAQLDDKGAGALLARVARVLHVQLGEVVVIGHTDDTAPASMQFPSNWQLSRSRAQAVADQLIALGAAPASRVHAEGRAEAQPRVQAGTAEARARNRRIEIELHVARPGGAS
jgi:type VI secretion system protein ImpK